MKSFFSAIVVISLSLFLLWGAWQIFIRTIPPIKVQIVNP